MGSTAIKCRSCGKEFYSSSSNSNCPDCKRANDNHQKNVELQNKQQKHDQQLKEKELSHLDRISEQNRRHDRELFIEKQKLEENRIQEHRNLQEEILKKQELDSINSKIYTLALNKSNIENIDTLIKLLLQQHSGYNDFIYKNIVELEEPFKGIIKQIISEKIKRTIEEKYSKVNYSFQRKCVKYFMPEFSGYEFNVFSDKLIEEGEFKKAIEEEIEEIEFEKKIFIENGRKEIDEINKVISEFNYAIQNDSNNNDALKVKMSISSKLFGSVMSSIPNLNILIVVLYVGYIYYFDIKFEWLLFILLMIIGYVITYAIISTNKKKETIFHENQLVIMQNESALHDLINKKERLEKDISNNNYNKTQLIESLIKYLEIK